MRPCYPFPPAARRVESSVTPGKPRAGHVQASTWVLQGMMDDPVTVEQFCRRYVEPMGEESDHIHIVAITDALQVRKHEKKELKSN